MSNWNLKEIDLPLKFTWSISRNSSPKKTNFIVEYKSNSVLGLGEVAFNVRYGETIESVRAEFERFKMLCPNSITTLGQLEPVFKEAKVCNSLRFGLESAFIHNMAHISEIPVSKIIGANTISKVKTSFSLPIMEPALVSSFVKDHNLTRFSSLKLKVGGQSDLELVKELSKVYDGPIRLDANEGWDNPELVMKWLETDLRGINIEFLEQPFKSSAHQEYLELKKISPVEIIADESLIDGEVNRDLANQFHGVNIKLMKSGSYFKALNQLRTARELGLKTMVGCMIESSLGINSAMNIAYGADYCDLDGFLILEKDPYSYVYEDGGTIFLNHLH
ncbi:enolase C-terminal domain-like protein [Halobacteriovorax sp. HLS]|uniref:enolase C-terminal domain-like protein n=1 Tax=Halobacteriovorax sp. HLS TaxID=2234000 RepID=UPI000FD6F548|nr:enolase C-terminal domain-like protein [Halobacteriovorax sp. HLS]